MKVSFWSARLYFENLDSRSPPQMKIHWRTTRRLQSPNLVALVKLTEHGACLRAETLRTVLDMPLVGQTRVCFLAGAALKTSDLIYWAEVSHHPPHGGKPQDEARNRENGYLAINMSSINGFEQDDIFSEGDHVAIIDCMTFVPEYIPVLKALQNQKQAKIPFEDSLPVLLTLLNVVLVVAPRQDGSLLNLCSWHRPDLSCMLDADADLSNYSLLVESMVEESSLPPIMAIRRDPLLSEKMLGCTRPGLPVGSA